MKSFWLKLNMRTKVMFSFFGIVLILSIIGWANYKKPDASTTVDNSDFIDKITNRNPILSYPVSYSKEWQGKITLVPVAVRDLEYAPSSSGQCSGITNNMDVYYTTAIDSIMIISNKNLMITPTEISNFNTAKDIINGVSDFNYSNSELQTFRTYCSYFSLYKVDELDNKMPSTDASRSILGLGLRQDSVSDISGVGLYIYVYAAKDDYLIQLSESLQGSFLFSQSNWDTCKTKSLQTDQNACLDTIYTNDPSMKSKIENEADKLMKTFELSNEQSFQ